jgi:hypothetical protein
MYLPEILLLSPLVYHEYHILYFISKNSKFFIFPERNHAGLLTFMILGVAHADELIYLFIFPFASVPPGLNRTEEELSKKMLQVWTNFVIYG